MRTFFTVRDSPDDVINVTMWMGQDLASDYDENYHIGDVVELVNVRVQLKDHSPSNQRLEFVDVTYVNDRD